MKWALTGSVVLFLLVSLFHLLRVVWGLSLTVGTYVVPMWPSVLGTIVPLVLAVGLLKRKPTQAG